MVKKQTYDEGIIILTCGDQSLRFRPHLNVTKEEIQMVLDKINSIFE
jgi:L-lysine 6-transaminase